MNTKIPTTLNQFLQNFAIYKTGMNKDKNDQAQPTSAGDEENELTMPAEDFWVKYL